MKCKEAQELILTDFIDEQLAARQQKQIEAHLKDCPRCREFAAHARKIVAEPFLRAEKIEPPETLWLGIRERLSAERDRTARGRIVALLEKLTALVPAPAAAFALALIFVMTLAAGVTSKMVISQKKTAERIEYLAYLNRSSTGTSGSTEQGLGTLIEEYFL